MKTFSKEPGIEKLIEQKCLLCSSSDLGNMYKVGKSNFVKCKECGLVFQNPMPVPGDLAQRYDDEYFNYEINNENNFFNLMLLGLNDISFFTEYENKVADKTFLDIGCATGLLLDYMKDRGWNVKGVEPCSAAALYGREKRGLDIRNTVIEKTDFEKESFSVIHCSHVIEHITSPDDFMKRVYSFLRPGGYFIVTTPNISGLQAKIYGRKWRSAIEDHMVLYSYNTLMKFSFKNSFKFIKSKTWGGLAAGTRLGILKKPLDKLAKRYNFGDVMILLLKK